ncbi:hypothetical protein HRED_07282 [Candidatus Haloredivivus sp. G17]|nr:hypothetical protein HRED_07282 [Candidatus Haloredivivus sp. G17]
MTLLSYATVVFATEQPGAGMKEVVMLSLPLLSPEPHIHGRNY